MKSGTMLWNHIVYHDSRAGQWLTSLETMKTHYGFGISSLKSDGTGRLNCLYTINRLPACNSAVS